YMDASEKARIQYENAYAQTANYWKNSMGMNKCIDSIGLIRQKQEYEARIRQWTKDSTITDKQYLVDFDELEGLYNKAGEPLKAFNYFGESFFRTSELISRSFRLNQGMEVKGDSAKPKKQYVEFDDNSEKWNLELDKEMTAAMLKNYAEHVPAAYLPDFYNEIKGKFGGDYNKYVEYVYKKSKVMKPGAKIYVNDKNYAKDPGVAIGMDMMALYMQLRDVLMPLYDSIDAQEKKLCAARVRMEEDLPHYSDANFTMRLSYGQVGGFMLGGSPSGYYTTAESIVEKMKKGDKIADYIAEPIMQELLSAKDFGQYQDKTTGKMQLCFLTNNDITGGNSGSPMFDGKGRLIGLAFDGNWDSLSSDIRFDTRLARCIGVDIRYVLFMMDRWGHADRLLKEINAK
ncbi:MAG: S46 family peptidase, partial [Prevotella sp.]